MDRLSGVEQSVNKGQAEISLCEQTSWPNSLSLFLSLSLPFSLLYFFVEEGLTIKWLLLLSVTIISANVLNPSIKGSNKSFYLFLKYSTTQFQYFFEDYLCSF